MNITIDYRTPSVSVPKYVQRARRALSSGQNGEAFTALDYVVSAEPRDPEIVRETQKLAIEGARQAGFIRRHLFWNALVKTAYRLQPGHG